MSKLTLTAAEAQHLYEARQCVLHGRGELTTRTAVYDWNPTLQVYERLREDLRVQHRAGAFWSRHQQCFVPCHCPWCAEHPSNVAAVHLYTPQTQKDV